MTRAILLYSTVAVAVLLVPVEVVEGQLLRQSAERFRSNGDIFQQLWDSSESKPKQAQDLEDDIREDRDELDMLDLFFSMATDPAVEMPSEIPSDFPSLMPSSMPSGMPSTIPSDGPSLSPTQAPTESLQPTFRFWPSSSPSISAFPSSDPTVSSQPSAAPTVSSPPTAGPTTSSHPSGSPSVSLAPSASPSVSAAPSAAPSISARPTEDGATRSPTVFPTKAPTASPSTSPSDAPTVSAQPSSSPTLENCPGFTEAERIAEILAILDGVGDPFLIRAPDTPQNLATDWLMNRDLAQTCPDDPKLVQRWALAVMYYSTNGNDWDQCSADGLDACGSADTTFAPFRNKQRFLSSGTECEWAGISCNIDECVTEVEFENNNLIGTIPT
ncbi:MAG: hypothetical protein SGARI_000364, partial [Bacillariaceae sp.]